MPLPKIQKSQAKVLFIRKSKAKHLFRIVNVKGDPMLVDAFHAADPFFVDVVLVIPVGALHEHILALPVPELAFPHTDLALNQLVLVDACTQKDRFVE